MPEQEPNIDHIKGALTSSGILKSTQISEADQKKVSEALAAKGVKPEASKLICSRAHYCIVVPK